MGSSVRRNVQIRADQLKSATLTAAEVDRIIADNAIDRGRLSYLSQEGSARIGTTRYIDFPTAYSAVPSVSIARLGSWDYSVPIQGSADISYVESVVAGSFKAFATPTSYYLWQAQGSA